MKETSNASADIVSVNCVTDTGISEVSAVKTGSPVKDVSILIIVLLLLRLFPLLAVIGFLESFA
jgi:hypothetical protein